MPFGQPKQTEGERVKAWKKKNPEKVANQRRRKILRKKAAERAADPTGELNYGPLEGVDEPYPEDKPMFPQPPKPQPDPEPLGIEDPPELIEELEREHKRTLLANLRKELEKK